MQATNISLRAEQCTGAKFWLEPERSMLLEAIVPTAKGRIDERKRLGFANHPLQLFGRGLVGKRLLSFPEPYNSSMRLERVGLFLSFPRLSCSKLCSGV